MFSNLQTEGDQGNHIFLPESMRVFDYQNDLVMLVDSSDSMLARHAADPKRWVLFELRRYLSQRPDVSLTFEYVGTRRSVERAGDDPMFSEPPRFALRKLLWFRTVAPPEASGHRL